MASVGMMDPAYFVGKVELLTWLNDLLKINYTKVEQVCSQKIVERTQPLLLQYTTRDTKTYGENSSV